MSPSYIIAARRSAVAPRGGALSNLLPHELAAPVIADLLQHAGIERDQIDELILSNALGAGGNPARIAALAANLPERIAGLSIDRQCAGGLDAILLGDVMIRSGLHDVVIAGGVESYSRRPIRMHAPADGSAPVPYNQAPFTPWPDRDPDMATAADTLAQKLGISHEEQDRWAQGSHAKARAAEDVLMQEITPIAGLSQDSFTRDLTPRHCSRAKTVCGSITAANMAVAADGAAFVLMVSERIARNHSAVEVLSGATLGADPLQPGLAPLPAIENSLKRASLTPQDVDTAEIMEAFAVQAIACLRGAGFAEDQINRHGGALARGHPVGASGAILAVHLYHQLQHTKRNGLAAIAAAGGIGSALVLQG
ncbi:acetyl-CoA C-acyltransferase [Epibacterium sp. SM1969]|uniref:Acetyl-CoA C-acyltransferase n=1 Tax=Tritonibacter aquimaris TaxID=2663379 RepID=A0A844ANT4_9RHOB|nr:thiolase family protein [Tritonibacter aquimaris]MQY44390.1 acetyl-CoA C-acyltransferase [Tritonibacter aquimaris]